MYLHVFKIFIDKIKGEKLKAPVKKNMLFFSGKNYTFAHSLEKLWKRRKKPL